MPVFRTNDYSGDALSSGLAQGLALANVLDEKKRRKGLASGLSNYLGAQDEATKTAALQEMASADPEATSSFVNKQKLYGLGGAVNGYTPKGEFASLMALRETLPEDDPKRDLIDARLNYLTKTPEMAGRTAYESMVGRQQAQAGLPYGQQETGVAEQTPVTAAQLEAEKKEAVNRISAEKDLAQSQARLAGYDSLISEIESNEDLLGPLNKWSYKIGENTQGYLGMSDEDRQKYSSMMREIGDIRSNLISRAKAAGQSGINTAREIEMATAGIDFDMTKPSLVGAIKKLKEQEKRLDDAISDYYGIKSQQDESKTLDKYKIIGVE